MDKTKTEQLRELLAEAKPAPWNDVNAFAAHDTVFPSINGDYINSTDCDLICFLRNNATLLLEIVQAAEEVPKLQKYFDNKHEYPALEKALRKWNGGE